MRDTELSPTDKKHIRDAWIWAIAIIAVGVLCAAAGMFVQATSHGRDGVEAAARPL